MAGGAIVISVILGLFAILVILAINRINRRNGATSVLSGSLCAFVVYYCLVPIIAWSSVDDIHKFEGYLETLNKASDGDYFRMFVCFSIFIISTLVAYSVSIKTNKNQAVQYNKFKKYIRFFTFFTFFIGGLSFIAYAYSFGGFVQLLAYAEMMRSFATDKADLFTGRSFILVIPSRLITVSPILFLLYFRYVKKNLAYIILFTISLILSILFYLSNAGKTGILTFGLCFIVPLLSYKVKHEWLLTIFIGIIGVGIISYIDALFIYMASGDFFIDAEDGILTSLSQFSYPISNVLNLERIASAPGFRFGQDFITGLLNIIPGVNFSTSIEQTSIFYGGVNWQVTGGTPNDIITYGYLEFGVIGVLLMGVLLGGICGLIDNCLKTLNDSFAERSLKCSLIILFFLVIVSADTVAIVRNQFLLTILSLSVILSSKKRNIRHL